MSIKCFYSPSKIYKRESYVGVKDNKYIALNPWNNADSGWITLSDNDHKTLAESFRRVPDLFLVLRGQSWDLTTI